MQEEKDKKEAAMENNNAGHSVEGASSSRKKSRCLPVVLISGLIAALILIVGSVLLQRTVVLPDTGAAEVAEQFSMYQGMLNGAISYPSDYIPPLQICAENTKSKETICTLEMIRSAQYEHGYGYALTVPGGSYHIYAQTVNENGDVADPYKSYYSQFVVCGMDVACTVHTPIVVKVEGGDALSGIDPIDWYVPL